jgi:arsenite methyltransferase
MLPAVGAAYIVCPTKALAFAEFANALKSSGQAVIGFGDPDVMQKLPIAPYGFRIRPVPEIVTALERADLTLKEHRQSGRGAGRFHMLLAAPREAAGARGT